MGGGALHSVEQGLAAACLQYMTTLFGGVRADTVFDLQPPVLRVDRFLSRFEPDTHAFFTQVRASDKYADDCGVVSAYGRGCLPTATKRRTLKTLGVNANCLAGGTIVYRCWICFPGCRVVHVILDLLGMHHGSFTIPSTWYY